MADIRFEADTPSVSPYTKQKNSRVTQFFIDASFGVIKTPDQAVKAQVCVAVVLFILMGYFLSKTADTTGPTKPSQDLINAPQPVRPLDS